MAFERLADRVAARRVPDPRGLVVRGGGDALPIGAERCARRSVFMDQNEPLAEIPRGAVELQLRLGHVWPINPCGAIGQSLERDLQCSSRVTLCALLACEQSEVPRLRDL